MADKLIITKNGIFEEYFTEEELKKEEELKLIDEQYKITEEQKSQQEAITIKSLSDRIQELEKKIAEMQVSNKEVVK